MGGGLSIWHLLVVLVVAMVLFGGARVAELGKGLGEGIKSFKKGLREDDEPAPKRPAAAAGDEEEEIQIVRVPKQLTAGTPKKKRVIQVEVDEDADEEEIARQVAKKKAAHSEDEKAT
jgi:sec-independent protein translocase protein TatA